MDKEIYLQGLKEYGRNKDKDILKLVKYTKKLDIEDEVVELIEVLGEITELKVFENIKSNDIGNTFTLKCI